MEVLNGGLVRFDPDAIEPYPSELDLSQIPITALRQKCRSILSSMLNNPKILLSEEGLPRDWRGIAHLANLHTSHGALIAGHHDPITKILQMWSKGDNAKEATFEMLLKYLGIIDRWDVSDDIRDDLIEDAKIYLTTKHDRSLKNITQCNTSPPTAKSDANILTIDDVTRSNQGLAPQQYDGFVLFADEDIDFATELIERMEDCGFKLCVKERDLIGGVSFEHEAILKLISERCNRLIVIVSPAFLESPANNFFVNFATALGITERRRRIIPCLYRQCVLPETLEFYFLLNYQRSGKLWNFWDKLKKSIESTPEEKLTERNQMVPRITITEVDSSASLNDMSKRSEIRAIEENKTKTPEKNSRITSPMFCNNITSSTDPNINVSSPVLNKSEPIAVQIMPPPIKMRTSASMVNLTTATTPPNSDVCDITSSNSNLAINNGSVNKSGSTKKVKWYKKFLSPNAANSDTNHNSTITTNTTTKEKTKRKWLRRKLASYS